MSNAKDVRNRRKDYCSDLYNVELGFDQIVLTELHDTNQDIEPAIEEIEVEMTIKFSQITRHLVETTYHVKSSNIVLKK